MRLTRSIMAVALVALPVHAIAAQQRGACTTTSAITAADLRCLLSAFAADSMRGRQFGDTGNVMATAMLAHEAERIGLRPAGEGGTFFQNIPVRRRTVATATLTVAGAQPLTIWRDFYPVLGRFLPAIPEWHGEAVFGGTFDFKMEIDTSLVAGKVVVVNSPAPNGFFTIGAKHALGSAAMIVLVNKGPIPAGLASMAQDPSLEYGNRPTIMQPAPVTILVSPEVGAAIMGRPLEGLKVGDKGRMVSGSITERIVDLTARNVIALLPATTGTAKEYIAIGAHSDHLGLRRSGALDHDSLRLVNAIIRPAGADSRPRPLTSDEQASVNHELATMTHDSLRPDSIFNGADDDGSGSVALLEIAERLAADPAPRDRNVLFVWHTGEELGTVGSRYFIEHPTVPLASIVAQLNVDMIGRGGADDLAGGGPQYLQLIGTRRRSTMFGALIDSLNGARKEPFRIDYAFDAPGESHNIFCRSDHWSYASAGIPVAFFTTGMHRDYHQLTDEVRYIDFDHYARVTSFIADIAAFMVHRTTPLTLDVPAPGDGRCVQ